MTPRSKSMMPSASPSSQCGFGSKSNLRGSPQRRISTLSCSSLPFGTLECGIFGSLSASSSSSFCISADLSSSSFISSPSARISFWSAVVSSPAFFLTATSLEPELRFSFSDSTRSSVLRRSSSSSLYLSSGNALLRDASISATSS